MRHNTPFFSVRALSAVLLLAASTMASATQTPASLTGATVVSAEQAKKLADTGTPIVDTRVANEYAEEHIEGAIGIPYREKSAKAPDFDPTEDSFDLSKLPADKSAGVIFACNGPECWKSYKACKMAINAGWKKVLWLRGGFPEWKAKGYPVD